MRPGRHSGLDLLYREWHRQNTGSRLDDISNAFVSTMQVLVEQSLIGWKEFELEVMRDLADNVVIICSIENVDPMGVHTGDSITIAPAQTLTDKEYQRLRDASVAIIREMGVECGGSNVQLAVDPKDGQVNPLPSPPDSLARWIRHASTSQLSIGGPGL